MSDDLESEAVRLAIMAAGAAGSDHRAWGLRIAELVPQVAAMLRPVEGDDATTPMVTARKVLGASVFTAEFVKFSDEEMSNTHRLLVAFRSKTSDDKELDGDGLEWLRTEPNWTRAGYVLQRRIRELEPGTSCTVYKHVESIPGNKKVRVLVHLDARGRPRQSEPRQSAPSAERAPSGGDAGGAQQPSAAAAPPATSQGNSAVTERFNALKPAQQVALARVCRGHGIDDFIDPEPDNLDKVLVWIGKLERGEALT